MNPSQLQAAFDSARSAQDGAADDARWTVPHREHGGHAIGYYTWATVVPSVDLQITLLTNDEVDNDDVDYARLRISPSCAVDTTSLPVRSKKRPRARPLAPEADGLSTA